MEEKKYLKWYNKIGYGSGDIGGNVVYAFLASFVMIYLTDTIGLEPGIVGTLMAVAKLFDGISDFFFGSLVDRTKSKMGKARPWMFWAYFGNAVTLILIFAIPVSWGDTAKYAYFFIMYVLLNAVFYTANNISYSTLTSLITRNATERVQLGSIRFIFAFGTSLLIQTVTVGAVAALGGTASAWRTIAIIYAIIGVIFNTIAVFSVKELPDEENINKEEKNGLDLIKNFKLLIANKYYLMITGLYVLGQFYVAVIGMGLYYMTYILKNPNMYGVFSWTMNIPLMIGLLATPFIVAKLKSMYKIDLIGYIFTILFRLVMIFGAFIGSIPIMLVGFAISSLGQGPLQGSLTALTAASADYTYHKTGKRIDGTLFSCVSFGTKVGSGLGTAICGWLLGASGYIANAEVQTASCVSMLNFMYLWLPLIIAVVQIIIIYFLRVEKANEAFATSNQTN